MLVISDKAAKLLDEGADSAKTMAPKIQEEDAATVLVLSLNRGIGLLTIITLIGRITASMIDLADGKSRRRHSLQRPA